MTISYHYSYDLIISLAVHPVTWLQRADAAVMEIVMQPQVLSGAGRRFISRP